MRAVSTREIRQKLQFLHNHPRLPKQPTAVPGLYTLPATVKWSMLEDASFSRELVQQVSDHIGHFLGMLDSVRVKVGVETSEHLLAAAGRAGEADTAGVYEVRGGAHREIRLVKKVRFRLKHVLAILAHESTHCYLLNCGIAEPNEFENEVLTDVAATYLGLGRLVLSGYEPIVWETDHWRRGQQSGFTRRSMRIGYLQPTGVRQAIAISAELRAIREYASLLPLSHRLVVYFRLWRLRKRGERRKQRARALLAQLGELEDLYDLMASRMVSVQEKAAHKAIGAAEGAELVELANELSVGKCRLSLDRALARARQVAQVEDVPDAELVELGAQALHLSGKIRPWYEVVCKHSVDV